MRTLRAFIARLLRLPRAAEHEREFAEQLDADLQLMMDDYLRAGMTPAEAQREAVLRVGGLRQVKEAYRDQAGAPAIEAIVQDLRLAARTLPRAGGFFVAVLSLALGAGATAAVYNSMDWLLNRPPGGVAEPERLMTLRLAADGRESGFSIQQYAGLQDIQEIFDDVAIYGKFPGILSSERIGRQVVLEFVTSNYFELLGLRPAFGRLFSDGDDAPGSPPVAILSYQTWHSVFGGDPDVLRNPVRLNGQLSRIVGILPKEFEGYLLDWSGPTGVWLPIGSLRQLGQGRFVDNDYPFFMVVARLCSGMTVAAAQAHVGSWVRRLPAAMSGTVAPTAIVAVPSIESRISRRDAAGTFLGALLLVCGLTLIAASFNGANFFLGRLMTRRRELALRAALGAGRGRILQQLAAEAAVFGLCAAALALLAAAASVRGLSSLPRFFLDQAITVTPILTPTSLDVPAGTAAALLVTVSTVMFGLLPSLAASFRHPASILRHQRVGWTWSRLRPTPRQLVFVFQVALAVALAGLAVLYGQSFARAGAVDAGYLVPESVLLARVEAGGPAGDNLAFYRGLLTRLHERPDVVAATIGVNPPFNVGRTFVPAPDNSSVETRYTLIAPRFFETLGIPIIAGREFTDSEADRRDSVIVNRVLAARLWPGQVAVGRTMMILDEPRLVIGIAGADRCNGLLAEPGPCAWGPLLPGYATLGYVRIRTNGPPMALVPVLRQLVRDLHVDAVVSDETTLSGFVANLTGRYRMAAVISAGLAGFAILLLAIGGVSLFVSMVKESVREIAIRMVLGATAASLTRRILTHGLVLTSAGAVIGVAGALIAARNITDQLYRTEATDPAALVLVPLLVGAFSIAAVGYAARVAIHTEPAKSLQAE